jgi:hypothetical protein
MKVKSSLVLAMAIDKIKSGETQYGCAAITFSMNDLQDQHGSFPVNKAQKHYEHFMPEWVNLSMKGIQRWWPLGDPLRLEALEAARQRALKSND